MDFTKIMATWWSGNCYHTEQLKAITSSPEIKAYAYILHDKCKMNDSEELKKPHYHFLVQLYKNQRGSWFKQFKSEDMGIVFAQPCRTPDKAFDYLIHDTNNARKEGKHLYDPSERVSTIESFENNDKRDDEHAELYEDLIELLQSKITWHDLIKKKPKRIHMIANIKVAYDLLHYEIHGYRYFDRPQLKPPKAQPQLTKATPEEEKDLPF
ncbi:MAG: replication protein [Firmicutes bacterium]|nr:replication protein [Bacillota bacterium]